jgi:hypothetical protein
VRKITSESQACKIKHVEKQARDSSNSVDALSRGTRSQELLHTLTWRKNDFDNAPQAMIKSGSGLARWLTIDNVERDLVACGD